jgi:hypothetical protein
VNRVQKIGSVQHIRALEDSLSRARNYIEELHEKISPASQKDIDSIFVLPTKFRSPSEPSRSDSVALDGDQSPKLENMMELQEQMNSADHKTAAFYCDSSGFAFLQKTKQLFDDTQGSSNDSDLSTSTQRAITQLFDSPLPDKQALQVDVPVSNLLPKRQTASDLLHVVFGQVYPLLQFLDQPTFQERTDRIYEVEPMDYTDSDHDFLPLLYAVLALGFLFSQEKHQQYGCARAVTEGYAIFHTFGSWSKSWLQDEAFHCSTSDDGCYQLPGHCVFTGPNMLYSIPNVNSTTRHVSYLYRSCLGLRCQNGSSQPGTCQ